MGDLRDSLMVECTELGVTLDKMMRERQNQG